MTQTIEQIVISGNLEALTLEQRTAHYMSVCQALDLDYRTHPLEYLQVDDPNFGRRLILYALRAATDQIRRNKKIKITKLVKELSEDVVTYVAEGEDKDGVTEISTGSVGIKGKRGQELANAFMAAETKAKRRLTLAFSGSGLLDETEVADINAPTSMAPGLGVTAAAPNLSAPAPSEKAGQEAVPVETKKDPEPVKQEPKKKSDQAFAEGVASLKNKKSDKYADAVDQLGPDMAKDAPATLELGKEDSKVVAEALSNPPEPNAALKAAANQGVLIETKSAEQPAKVEASKEETRDALNNRIVAYKRDILPAGGMRPSKGFGINAKLIKFFLLQFPERKTVDQFTNEELLAVLAKLDKVRAESGDNGVVALIDGEIGTK